MKAPDWNDELLAAHRDSIQSEVAGQGFDVLVWSSAVTPGYLCKPAMQGTTKVFHIDDEVGNERPFAIIVHRTDVRFNVRKPGFKRIPGGLRYLKEQFEEVKENNAGEWTVHLRDAVEAARMARLVFGSAAVDPNRMRHWWVNHKQPYRQERDGGYLWSPKKNANGANNESYNNMTRAQPGDFVWSFANGEVGAVGVVLGVAREARKPPEFGSTGTQWREGPGWQLPVWFVEIPKALDIQRHAPELAPTLPRTHSPIRANGHGNQGVYLAAVPDAMAAAVKRLMGDQWEGVLGRLEDLGSGESLSDVVEEVRLEQRTDIGPTEKKTLMNARRGQGIYRTNLELIEQSCRLTGVMDRRHLRASHIKPWRISDDREKLDGYNGLLLSPHVDHLFDQGHISFDNDGTLLISKKLNRAVLELWGLKESMNVGAFRPQQCAYLQYHRDEVFGKKR